MFTNHLLLSVSMTPSGAHEGRRKKEKKKKTAVQNCHRPCFCKWNIWGRVGKVTLSGLNACQSWWVVTRHLSAVSAAKHCDPCLSPRLGELSYPKIPNNSWGVYLFQSLKGQGVYLGQAFNSFLSKIWNENPPNYASFSVNSLAYSCKWSRGWINDSSNQPLLQTPHLCCHSRWCTFVSPSPWSFCRTLSHGVPVCW